MKRKRKRRAGLSVERHFAIGITLCRVHHMLQAIATELAHADGHGQEAEARAVRIIRALSKLRAHLDGRLASQTTPKSWNTFGLADAYYPEAPRGPAA